LPLVRRAEAPSAPLPRRLPLRRGCSGYRCGGLPLPNQGPICLRRKSLHSRCGSATSTASGRRSARVPRASIFVRSSEISCCRRAVPRNRSASGQERFHRSASHRDDRHPPSGCPMSEWITDIAGVRGYGATSKESEDDWLRRVQAMLCGEPVVTIPTPSAQPPEPVSPPSSRDTSLPSR
jgi:hypothetical protein